MRRFALIVTAVLFFLARTALLSFSQYSEQIEAIIGEDPFCKRGLAEPRIVEFRASQRADDIQKRIEG